MKKNLIFGMLAAAGLLLASSCQTDELDATSQLGGAATVSFSVGLENGAQTRAISDGTGADVLYYAIYDASGKLLPDIAAPEGSTSTTTTGVLKKESAFSTGLTETVTLSLAKGQTYTAVFWAQDADCTAYTVGTTGDNSEMTITVDYTTSSGDDSSATGAANNDETRDAFFGKTTIKVSGSSPETVYLKRPFAQINVGVTSDDWSAAVNSGVTIEQSSVTIDNAATSINLLTGAVSGSATVEYTLNATPAEQLTGESSTEESLTVNGTDYKWLSMSYILVNDASETADDNGMYGAQKATLTSLAYTFDPKEETGKDITLDLSSVPAQRNYRTNIIGKLLTGDIDFSIVIDKDYTADYKYPDGIEDELSMVAQNGGTYTMETNAELDGTLYVTAEDVTIDLNGNSITYSSEASSAVKRLTKADDGTTYLIQVESTGELTINGEGEVGSDGGISGINVVAGGSLTINGGTYYGALTCETDGTISITGGTFYQEVSASYYDSEAYKVETITDGSTTYYMVVEKSTSVATSSADIIEALADDTITTIVVLADTDLSTATEAELTFETAKTIEIEEGVTLQLGENSLVAEDGLTLTGGGTIETTAADGTTKEQVTVIKAVSGECVIDGVTLINDTDYHYHGSGGYESKTAAILYYDDADITITNSTITSGMFVICAVGDGYTSNVTIENCTFESTSSSLEESGNYAYALDLYGSYVTINDCEIKGIQGAVGLGACVAEINGGTYYTVNTDGNTDAFYAVYAYDGSYVFITDGKFSSPNDKSSSTIDIEGTSSVVSHYGGNLILMGGQYSGKAYDINADTNPATYTVYETPYDGYEWQALEDDTSGLNLVWEVVPSTSTAVTQQSLAARRPTLNAVKPQLKIDSVGRRNIR